MIRAMYTAASGMVLEARRMDLTARNMFNAQIPGYKTTVEVREAVAPNDPRKPTDVQTLYWGEFRDPTPGRLKRSSHPLDLALEGDGFFAVQTDSGVAYTRDGRFRRGLDGTMVGPAGSRLLGQNGPIQLPTDLGPDAQLRVDEQGRVLLDGNEIDRIQLADFPGFRGLRSAGPSLYYPTGAVQPRPARPRVFDHMLEQANVQIVAEMSRTIEAVRAFESYQRVITTVMEDVTGAAVRQIGRVA